MKKVLFKTRQQAKEKKTVVESPSLGVFKRDLDVELSDVVWWSTS